MYVYLTVCIFLCSSEETEDQSSLDHLVTIYGGAEGAVRVSSGEVGDEGGRGRDGMRRLT